MEEKGSSEILPSSSWKGSRSNGVVAEFLAEFPTHPLAYLHHRLASPKPGVSRRRRLVGRWTKPIF